MSLKSSAASLALSISRITRELSMVAARICGRQRVVPKGCCFSVLCPSCPFANHSPTSLPLISTCDGPSYLPCDTFRAQKIKLGNIAWNCLWDMASQHGAAVDTIGSVRYGLCRDTLYQPTWAQLTVGCLLHASTEPLVFRTRWELGQQLRKADPLARGKVRGWHSLYGVPRSPKTQQRFQQ